MYSGNNNNYKKVKDMYTFIYIYGEEQRMLKKRQREG